MAALVGCTSGTSHEGEGPMTGNVPKQGSVVAFYGDSLTAGFGASSPDRRWSTLLCARHQWSEVNPSIPGLGFVQDRGDRDLPGTIIDSHPDLVIVTLGANDLRLVDSVPTQVESAIDTDLTRLRNGVGDAPILVAMPFSPLRFRPPQLTKLERWLRSAAEDIDAAVIESDEWMAGRDDLTVDGIHFNDAGEKRISELMDAAIREALARS